MGDQVGIFSDERMLESTMRRGVVIALIGDDEMDVEISGNIERVDVSFVRHFASTCMDFIIT